MQGKRWRVRNNRTDTKNEGEKIKLAAMGGEVRGGKFFFGGGDCRRTVARAKWNRFR